jgi:hypothetical protein
MILFNATLTLHRNFEKLSLKYHDSILKCSVLFSNQYIQTRAFQTVHNTPMRSLHGVFVLQHIHFVTLI